MKFCAQRGCNVPIKADDVLCPCCKHPLADDSVTPKPPAAPKPPAPQRTPRQPR